MPFQRPWLTLDTNTEPEIQRIKPQIAPMTAALTMNTGTCAADGLKPVSKKTADRCQRENAMLPATRTHTGLTPAPRSEAHSQPRKNPSSVRIATSTVETLTRTKFKPALRQSV